LKKLTLITVAALVLAGCAASPALRYPAVPVTTVTIPSAASLQSDVGPADYLVPDSHVYVGGRTGATDTAGALGGLFGLGIGIGIDQLRNRSDVGDSAQPLQVTFDKLVADDLRKTLAAGGAPAVIEVVDAGRRGGVTLLPFARFHNAGETGFVLQFFLYAQLSEPGDKWPKRITFDYSVADARPFSNGKDGWADAGGAALRAAADRAFEVLVAAFVADVRGRLDRSSESLRTVSWRKSPAELFSAGAVVMETEEFVMTLPKMGNLMLRNRVHVVERSRLTP
jgi:hypothetical protein